MAFFRQIPYGGHVFSSIEAERGFNEAFDNYPSFIFCRRAAVAFEFRYNAGATVYLQRSANALKDMSEACRAEREKGARANGVS